MHAIVNTDVVLEVHGSLIDVDGRCCCATKSGRAHVWERNQWQERLDNRIRNPRALSSSRNSRSGKGQALSLAQAFIAEEEERFVFALVAKYRTTLTKMRHVQRSAEIESKLVSFERGRLRGALEVIACVENVVAQELEKLAVIVVRARAGRDVHDRAGVAAVLSAEG